ncbi:MAG: 50S ribosomal protein L6 [Halanaerobiales bacterium]
MSRIGDVPVEIPEKVDVSLNGTTMTVKGPKGELSKEINPGVEVNIEEDNIVVKRHSDDREDRSLHGLVRSIIKNMINGVVKGYSKELEMVGVGYRAQLKGSDLEIEAGYSHPVTIEAPDNIEFEVENGTEIKVKGIDKQQVGDIAARIRAVRKPEPYKGKGIRYKGEHIRRKVGKTG